MPRPRIIHWRFLILLALLAIALLDAKLDRGHKSLTILWKPTSKLRIDDGVRAIERGIATLWRMAPGDAGVRVTPVRSGARGPREAKKASPGVEAATGREGAPRDPGALDRHSEQDRRRLDRAVSGH
jgi:hypothetical protein